MQDTTTIHRMLVSSLFAVSFTWKSIQMFTRTKTRPLYFFRRIQRIHYMYRILESMHLFVRLVFISKALLYKLYIETKCTMLLITVHFKTKHCLYVKEEFNSMLEKNKHVLNCIWKRQTTNHTRIKTEFPSLIWHAWYWIWWKPTAMPLAFGDFSTA